MYQVNVSGQTGVFWKYAICFFWEMISYYDVSGKPSVVFFEQYATCILWEMISYYDVSGKTPLVSLGNMPLVFLARYPLLEIRHLCFWQYTHFWK